MRVAQVVDGLGGGGAERLVAQSALRMRARGVTPLVFDLAGRRSGPIRSQLEDAGVRVEVVGLAERFAALDVRAWRRLRRMLRDESVDVVHTHLTYSTIIGVAAARSAGRPVVSSVHNEAGDRHGASDLRWRLETIALRAATEVLAVGPNVASLAEQRLDRPVTLLVNPVDPSPTIDAEARRRVRTELVGEPDLPLVVGVGRLSEQKGWPDLVEAFALLGTSTPDARLAIVGDGRRRNEVSAAIDRHGLGARVVLAGHRTDVPAVLAAADVYVSASHWEGLPLALLEAMSAGLPVVATAVGDVPSLVDDGVGRLVEPGRPEALAAALADVLAQPDRGRALGDESRRRILSQHDPDVWADELVRLYRRVLTGGAA